MPRAHTAVNCGADALPLALRVPRWRAALRGGAPAVTQAAVGVGESAFGAAFEGAIGDGNIGGGRGVGVGGRGERVAVLRGRILAVAQVAVGVGKSALEPAMDLEPARDFEESWTVIRR